MATLASVNVSSSLSANTETPVAFGQAGMILEVFRVPGGAVGDTAALTPQYIKKVKTVLTGMAATTDASTSGASNVTVTLKASAATNVTFDVWVVGNRE